MGREEEIEELERRMEALRLGIRDLEKEIVKRKRDKENEEYLGVSIILAVAFVVSYQLFDLSNFISQIISISVFTVYLVASVHFRLDFRISIITAILLLAFCALSLVLNLASLANQGGYVAYHFLVFGVIGLIVDQLRETKQSFAVEQKA